MTHICHTENQYQLTMNPYQPQTPPMNQENVEELRQYGEELIEEENRICQIRENLVWKYEGREMQY
ncbi:hypothetical protein Hanom_Chr08g00720751 [Helianthus anomalus]